VLQFEVLEHRCGRNTRPRL
jgi:hypothetical protein